MKKQFTLSDADFAVLDRVAASCGLTHSQVLTQYIRRYSTNLEQLLSTYSNLEQPLETQGNQKIISVNQKPSNINSEQAQSNLETTESDFRFTEPIPGFD